MWGFGSNASISLNIESKQHTTIKDSKGKEVNAPLLKGDDDIIGALEVKMKKGKKLDH